MNYGEPKSAPSDFRVLTRIYPHGQPEEIESSVPLHPKVKAYLEHWAGFLRFEIYDSARSSFCIYNSQGFLRRKIYYVPYRLADYQPMMVGGGTVMIFDQMTGKLLYDGGDGDE
jgi:hypothetical protein